MMDLKSNHESVRAYNNAYAHEPDSIGAIVINLDQVSALQLIDLPDNEGYVYDRLMFVYTDLDTYLQFFERCTSADGANDRTVDSITREVLCLDQSIDLDTQRTFEDIHMCIIPNRYPDDQFDGINDSGFDPGTLYCLKTSRFMKMLDEGMHLFPYSWGFDCERSIPSTPMIACLGYARHDFFEGSFQLSY